MDEKTLQGELNVFLKIGEGEHKTHFRNHEPTIEEWKKIRHFYAQEQDDMPEIEDMNLDGENHFNTLDITLYLRHPNKVDFEDMKQYQKIAQDRVPGYDFATWHTHVLHDKEICMDGDIFTNPKAQKWGDFHQFERPDK